MIGIDQLTLPQAREALTNCASQLAAAKAFGCRACLCGALVAGVVDGPDAIACPECGSTEGVVVEAAWEANRAQLAAAQAANVDLLAVCENLALMDPCHDRSEVHELQDDARKAIAKAEAAK